MKGIIRQRGGGMKDPIYAKCEKCSQFLTLVRENDRGQTYFSPCVSCMAKSFTQGYRKAQEKHKEPRLKAEKQLKEIKETLKAEDG